MTSTEYTPEYYASRRMSQTDPNRVPRTVERIRRVAALDRGMRLLEVGCGFGGVTRALAADVGHVTGIDISTHAIQVARADPAPANVEFHEADVLTYRPAGTFDLVLALAVFEHFDREEQRAFLDNVRRWLAPGGRIVLHVPIADSWSGRRRCASRGRGGMDFTGDPTHKMTFSVRSFRESVTRCGYRVSREWIRLTRLGMRRSWARLALKALPARLQEALAMEALIAAEPAE